MLTRVVPPRGPEAKASAFVRSVRDLPAAAEYDRLRYVANANMKSDSSSEQLRDAAKALTDAIARHEALYEADKIDVSSGPTLVHRNSIFVDTIDSRVDEEVKNAKKGGLGASASYVSSNPYHLKIALVSSLAATTLRLLRESSLNPDAWDTESARLLTDAAFEALENAAAETEDEAASPWKLDAPTSYVAQVDGDCKTLSFSDAPECAAESLRLLESLLRSSFYEFCQSSERSACRDIVSDTHQTANRDPLNNYGNFAFKRHESLLEAQRRCALCPSLNATHVGAIVAETSIAKSDMLASYGIAIRGIDDSDYPKTCCMLAAAGDAACARIGMHTCDFQEAVRMSVHGSWTEADETKFCEILKAALVDE